MGHAKRVKTGRAIRIALVGSVMLAALVVLRRPLEGNLVALWDVALNNHPMALAPPVEERLVEHGGGSVYGRARTNTREALDANYARGCRLFELDFEWTRDGRLVLVHDWADTSLAFGSPPHRMSYAEFVTARRTDGLHAMTFQILRDWMLTHPEAIIVTDTKASNRKLLAYLAAYGAAILPRTIVQIYRLGEMDQARALHPRAVWLTAYRWSYPAWAMKSIIGVDAFVVPVGHYDRYRSAMTRVGRPFYVHSIPAASWPEIRSRYPGVYGFYID